MAFRARSVALMRQGRGLRSFMGRSRGFATVTDNTRFVISPLLSFRRVLLITSFIDHTTLLLLVVAMLDQKHALLLLVLERALH